MHFTQTITQAFGCYDVTSYYIVMHVHDVTAHLLQNYVICLFSLAHPNPPSVSISFITFGVEISVRVGHSLA